MGLLDDAIREHLDLKRRRGADPAEVERAEREALGPVRRKGDTAVAADPNDPRLAGEDDFDEDDEPTAGEPGPYERPEGDEPRAGGVAYDQAEDDDWAYDDEEPPTRVEPAAGHDQPGQPERGSARDFDGGDEPFAAEPPRSGPPPADGETTEYDVEDALASEGEEGEDVLEETPEFLQDTPDHDRLWFEQRPPRDFDFDG